jgi:beta-lactamase regulating signal transducer with metallopeptidase domain
MNLAHPLARDLGWTLVHFLWQGALIALLLAFALLLLRRASARIRYAASLAALMLCVLAPALTLAALVKSRPVPREHPVVQQGASSWGEPEVVVRVETAHSMPGPSADRPSLLELWRMRVERLLPGLVTLWLAGIVLLSARLGLGWLRLRQLTRDVAPVGPEWERTFAHLCGTLGLRKAVRLFSTAHLQTPAVLGWWKPVVLLPLARMNGLTPAQVEALLAHELAHVRRHDYAVNILQSVVEVALFYHPAVWWISAKIREEREHCCDDVAVEICGNRLHYARALTALEEARIPGREFVLAAAGGSLLRRIRRLLVPDQTSIRAAGWPGAAALAIAIVAAGLAISALPRETQAQAQEAGAPAVVATDHAKPRFQIRRVADAEAPGTELMTNILQMVTAPVIGSAIPGGQAVIAGAFSQEEAEEIARAIAPSAARAADGASSNGPNVENAQSGSALRDGNPTASPTKPADDSKPLFTRTFRVEPHVFLRATMPEGEPIPASGGPLQEKVREYFDRVAGIAFPAFGVPAFSGAGLVENEGGIRPSETHQFPPRKAMFFNDRTGVLFVRAELAELTRIEQALYKAVPPPPPQMMIESRFVEITGAAFRELGMDWLGGTTSPGPASAPSPASPPGTFPGNGAAASVPGPGTPVQSAGLMGILNGGQFQVVLRTLEQRQGVNILSSPRVTTLSSRQAALIQAYDIKTVLGPMPEEITKAGFQEVPDGIELPAVAAIVHMGHKVDFFPRVKEEDGQIELSVKAAVNEFLGYAGEADARIPDAPIPLFRLRQREATATLQDGQTLVLGGFDDWTNSGEKLPERRLVLFVTATLIDAAGNRIGRSAGSPPLNQPPIQEWER